MEGYLWIRMQRLESCDEKKEGQSKVSSSQGTHFVTQLEALVRCQMTKRHSGHLPNKFRSYAICPVKKEVWYLSFWSEGARNLPKFNFAGTLFLVSGTLRTVAERVRTWMRRVAGT